jgi:GTP-binding protein EngB required for normal cell division
VLSSGPIARLRVLAELASDIGAKALSDDAASLANRVAEGRFFVACLGQFKRGKSTLLNALIGESILPTGVVPVTSVVTTIRHGELLRASVHHENCASEAVPVADLARYVTEAGNPGNVKAVAFVEVFVPNETLRGGLCLVDTPGIGSSSLAGEVTRAFVPKVDAALVVLGADPPISADELHLLEDVSKETTHLIFAINKADRLSDAELAEVIVFTKRLLMERLGCVPESLFVVSAAERLRSSAGTRDWDRLQRALADLAGDRKIDLLERRAQTTARRIGRQLLQAIDATTEAMLAPVADSDRRLNELRAWLVQAQQALSDFALLLGSEQQTIARTIREEGAAHLAKTQAAAVAELKAAIEQSTDDRAPLRRAAFDLAQDIARRAVHREMAVVEDQATRAYQRATSRFIGLANDFLQRLSATEPRLASLPPVELRTTLGGRRRFYFTEMMTRTAVTPWQVLLDKVVPHANRRRRITDRASAYLGGLLETNTSRVVNDLGERLVESRRELEADIRSRLTELVASAERAAGRAREIRDTGEAGIHAELDRLAAIRDRVQRLDQSDSSLPDRQTSVA